MGIELNLNLSAANGHLSEFGKVPAGTYALTVAGVEMKEAKFSGAHYMALKLRVTKGEFAGKCIGENLNLYHPNTEVAGYAQDTLKKIMTQIGHANPDVLGNTDELLNGGEFHAEVKIEPYTNAQGEERESSKLGFLVSKDTPLKDGAVDAPAAAPEAKADIAPASNPFAGKSTGAADLDAKSEPAPVKEEKPAPAPAAAKDDAKTPPWLKK